MNVLKSFLLIICCLSCLQLQATEHESIYTQRPSDPEAFYFTADKYKIRNDGKMDVSDALQEAINQLKKEKNFGILFIPEGKYLISKTIYIPGAIRLIGYGKKRPEFILTKNAPGFQNEVPDDKGKAKYMFWFTGSIAEPGKPVNDANAGTFYSAMSNVNLRIEDGNPHAVALRTHYAQHSFVNHIDIHIGKGKAGLFDVGNEMENIAFYGGDYGIYTTKASPGWPVMMVDSYFEGQRKAAIRSQESGLAMVNMQVKNVPSVFEIDEGHSERIFIENSRFENITGPAFLVSNENNSTNQITLRNVDCSNVPLLMKFRNSSNDVTVPNKIYKLKSLDHGLQIDNMTANAVFRTTKVVEPLSKLPAVLVRDIPPLPSMDKWVNIRDLGAVGDDVADDTKAFQDAIDKHDNIYVPQGWYKITGTLRMKANTRLIGLHPFGTQFRLAESTPAFSGFGSPQPVLESAEGGSNILNGIGINTGAFNYRAVGLKWMGNEGSYVNDVKFVGGHGGMSKPRPQGSPTPERNNRNATANVSTPYSPVYGQGMDMAWDTQYWSFWVTKNGGGTFKDIWTASTYASSGFYANNTNTPSRVYAMSLEHHVRNEARFKNVSNWKVYAFQFEEESRESKDCQPLELDNCTNMLFANVYMFQVIRVNTPYPYSIRVWNSKDIELVNVHNYAQTKYTTTVPLYDIGKDIEVRPWDFQKLTVTGAEKSERPANNSVGAVNQLASGFEFAEGIAKDSKGNIYFSENRMRRIYKWSVETNSLSMVADFHWSPLNLAFDSQDNLLVLFKYVPQPGLATNASMKQLPDAAGTSYNSPGETLMYSMDPNNPEETIKPLPLVPMGQVKNVYKALYPSNRRRDRLHDFDKISTFVPEQCFLAPDGKTIIPQLYDLGRGAALLEAYPGKAFYSADEYRKRTVKLDVEADGTLKNLKYFTEWGEFGSTVDKEGNLYVIDGQIHVFDKEGKGKGVIRVPERPSTIQFGGADGNTLFITGRTKLFSVKIK